MCGTIKKTLFYIAYKENCNHWLHQLSDADCDK